MVFLNKSSEAIFEEFTLLLFFEQYLHLCPQKTFKLEGLEIQKIWWIFWFL